MSDKMRDEFEKWAKSRGMNVQKSRSGSYYHIVATDNAWRAWQASRQVLVVGLPMARSDVDYGYEPSEIIDLLESAGIKYK